MRFMVLVKANKDSEAGMLPSAEMLSVMGAFNEGLIKDNMLLAGEGLQATSKGARLRFAGNGKVDVTNGPFPFSEELVAGFWVVRGASREEVVERFRSAPFEEGQIEIRQIFEAEDFGDRLPEGAS